MPQDVLHLAAYQNVVTLAINDYMKQLMVPVPQSKVTVAEE